MKKYFLILSLIVTILLPLRSFALGIVFDSSKNSYSPGEEFYIDVSIDPTGAEINAVEGSLKIQTGLDIVRIEDGNSIIKSWIQRPGTENQTNFVGIIPNGFDGYINTPNDSKGLLFRVVLTSKKAGNYDFSINDLKVARNDGLGTILSVGNKTIKIGVVGEKSNEKYLANDTQGPEINYEIVKDPNLFDGKYSLAFSVQDNNSGVKNVFVKEGSLDWKPAKSPYLLEDQSRKSIIVIRAIDNNNNETIEKVLPEFSAYFSTVLAKIILAVVMLGLLVGIYYAKKKAGNYKKVL